MPQSELETMLEIQIGFRRSNTSLCSFACSAGKEPVHHLNMGRNKTPECTETLTSYQTHFGSFLYLLLFYLICCYHSFVSGHSYLFVCVCQHAICATCNVTAVSFGFAVVACYSSCCFFNIISIDFPLDNTHTYTHTLLKQRASVERDVWP